MKANLGLMVFAAILVAVAGCSQDDMVVPMNALSTVSVGAVNGDPGEYCTTLFAGQDIDAGTVCAEVIDNGTTETLCITYTTTGGWELMEAHTWLGEDLADMPQTRKGNPIPGQFPDNSGEITGATTYTACFDLNQFGTEGGAIDLCDLLLYAAAHAALGKDTDGDGVYDQTETGWGDGDRMVDRGNWATYFTIALTCGITPGQETGETAFAYDCGGYANCFIDIDEDGDGNGDFNRWGWSNGALGAGTYYFDIYAGAGQCDLNKGTLVGLLTVDYDGAVATVTYNTCGSYYMDEVHLYVGNEILPRDNNGDYTVAPGQYPYIDDDIATNSYTFTVNGLSGNIYVVAHAVVVGDYGEGGPAADCSERGCVSPCSEYGVTWADFSGMPTTTTVSNSATAMVDVTLCDAKTVAVQAMNISSAQFKFNGGPLGGDFFQAVHSFYGDLNGTGTSRMNTRCLDANGSANGVMPNSYTLTWDFGDTPLDHTNFFMIGQFWRPENVATITAYAADGVTVVDNAVFAFEWLPAETGSYTFLEPLSWVPTAGTLKKSTQGDGPNSGYGFFRIPEGTEIGKIVFDVNDTKTSGTADELNWGIGCYGCIQ